MLELIKKYILEDYTYLRNNIHTLTGGYSVDHAVLSGIALGDRRTFSSFKRAHVSSDEGNKCVENLCERGIIEIESSQNFLVNKRGDNKISKKLLFTTPFLRFWFAFVSPIYKGIKEGNFEEFYKKYESRQIDFSDFIFDELALELTTDLYKEDPIKNIGKYWDDSINIDIVAKTKSGKIIAGNSKQTNSKLKKNDLNKLKAACESIGLKADTFILFTKKGFTSELKTLKGESLKLLTPRNLKILLEDKK